MTDTRLYPGSGHVLVEPHRLTKCTSATRGVQMECSCGWSGEDGTGLVRDALELWGLHVQRAVVKAFA